MPLWTPGSYKVRDHVQYLYDLNIIQSDKTISTERVNTSSWTAKLDGHEVIEIIYMKYLI